MRLTLFGTDRFVADASATTIAVYDTTLFEVPSTLLIRLPEAPHRLINQARPVPRADADFYFDVSSQPDCRLRAQDFLSFQQEVPGSLTLVVADRCEAEGEMTDVLQR